MNKYLERFKKLEVPGEYEPWNKWFISRDRCIAFMLKPDYSRFIPLGKYKLKTRRRNCLVKVLDLYVYSEHLYRAMDVFRRRKKFELGLYKFKSKLSGSVFAVKEGRDIILMSRTDPNFMHHPVVNLEDLVCRVNKSYLERLESWWRILEGKGTSRSNV